MSITSVNSAYKGFQSRVGFSQNSALSDLDQKVVAFFGGEEMFNKLPFSKIDTSINYASFPIEMINKPVMRWIDKSETYYISIRITVDIPEGNHMVQQNVYYLLTRQRTWYTRFREGNRGIIGALACGFVFLFQNKLNLNNKYYDDINPLAYDFCQKFMPRILKGKNLHIEELMKSKIPRNSDLRTISLVAKK